jgi:ESS family glutamate:Na+ symporter
MYLSSSGIAVKSFAAPEVWSTLIQVFVVLLAVLAGNTLRRKVRFLRRSLIPTALLGGLIILLFKFWPKFNDIIDKRFMETMTYHALALGFISMSLRPTKVSNRSNTRTVVETGTLTVGTYIIQGIVGLLITVPMYLFWRNPEAGRDIFYAGGLMLPMGYGQGPGQALNFGTIYQSVAAEQGINFQGIDFGLSIAAIGFLIGSIVGVIYMNILAHKNRLTLKEQETDTRYTLYDYDQGNELPHSESVDKLTIVISIVFMTYFFVYLFMSFIGRLELGDFGEKTVKPLVY